MKTKGAISTEKETKKTPITSTILELKERMKVETK